MIYDPKVTPWQVKHTNGDLSGKEMASQMMTLLRYAILAPSSHNSQPWKFSVGNVGQNEISVYLDRSRWLKVADADQREMHISIGCALENLLIATEHYGFAHQVSYFPRPSEEDLVATVRLSSGGKTATFREHLFDCIPARYTNHKPYDNEPISPGTLQLFRTCVVEEDIHAYLTSDMVMKRLVDDLVVQADAIQFADPTFREELGYWIGQGAFGAPWFMAKLSQLAVTLMNFGAQTAKKDSEILMSSPVLGVISSTHNTRKAQVQVGQVYERLHLLATYLHISAQPMNQVLQVPDLKARLRDILALDGATPQFIFRMGYGEPESEHTPRRPLEEVLV